MGNHQVAVKNDLLMFNVDFQGLSAAITRLAEHNGELSDFEKSSALSIIDDWERGIISELRNKDKEYNAFVRCFSNQETYYFDSISEDLLEKIALTTETKELYDKYRDLVEYRTEFLITKPKRPQQSMSMTFEDYHKSLAQYQLEEANWGFASRKINDDINNTQRKWVETVSKHDYMKEALRVARSFKRNANKYIKLAEEKSRLAKLNVTISNSDIRESLKELLDFTIA